jgi:hypothetical protein
MVRAFLLSFLARQYLLLQDKFAERYPHCWLAWEPGAWSVPASSGDTATTRLPTPALPIEAPPQGDALCFELAARSLRLGRAAENEIVINDATVSREHLDLSVDDARKWWVTVRGGSETRVNDGPVPLGQPQQLASGATIKTARVVLTFHDQAAFLERVAKAAQGLQA